MKDIKIAILNNSGNVGKSTLCENLFKPRIPDAEIIKVETINSDGTNDPTISAKEFDDIFVKINMADSAIIDIGASNIETFYSKLEEYRGAHDDINYFIIPVTPAQKQQQDSINTIQTLIDLGVSKDKIKFVLNQFDPTGKSPESQYELFLDGAKEAGLKFKNLPIVNYTALFSFLRKLGKSIPEILNITDEQLKEKAKTARSEGKKEDEELFIRTRLQRQSAETINQMLNNAFDLVFKGK